jgi:hypothetical protein
MILFGACLTDQSAHTDWRQNLLLLKGITPDC